MKQRFWEYFAKTEEDFKELWESAIFVLDTNVLLNFYSYSEETKEAFLELLRRMEGRLWLPYQVAEEFLGRRPDVIGNRKKAYKDAFSNVEKLENSFKNAYSHPFISETIQREMEELFSKLKKELSERKEAYSRQIRASDDSLLQTFGDIFENHVGEPYSSEKLQEIFAEGSERYAKKIPPGFEDTGKIEKNKKDSEVEESDLKRKYGDLILWLQTLDYANSEEVSIIFVTDDDKEDWWQKYEGSKGKKMKEGARLELIREFSEQTKQVFHMYSSEEFFGRATKHFDQVASDEIVNEIKEISQYQPAFEVDQGIRNALQVAEIERHGVINAISEALRVNPAFEIDQKIQDALRIAEHANIRDEMNAISQILGDNFDFNSSFDIRTGVEKVSEDLQRQRQDLNALGIIKHANTRDRMNTISQILGDNLDFNSSFDIRTGMEKVSEDLQRQRQALLESVSLASVDSVMLDAIRRSIEEAGLRNKKMDMINDKDTSEDE